MLGLWYLPQSDMTNECLLAVFTIAVIALAKTLWNYLHSKHDGRYSGDNGCKQTLVKNDSATVSCLSQNCVRCHRYRELQTQAKLKWDTQVKKLDTSDSLCRIKDAVDYPATNPKVSDRATLQDPNVLFVSGLKAMPYWPCDSFAADVRVLTSNFHVIQNEFETVAMSEACDNLWKCNRTDAGAWDVLHLYNQGVCQLTACSMFTNTCKVIENLTNFMDHCAFGNACFSVIYPGTKIEEHFGPCNIRIRCHLGLKVPASNQCLLSVAGTSRQWREGVCTLFDDSFLHKAEYIAQDPGLPPRVVFLIDLWHPELSLLERTALTQLYTL